MRRLAITMILIGFVFASQAQNTIKGSIIDKTDKAVVSGATVSLLLQLDSSLVKNVVSDSSGHFEFNNVSNDSFIVTVNTLNYQQYVSFITIRDNSRDLGNIGLDRKGTDLSVVTIVARVAPVSQKGDTAQYSASQFKVNPDANAEDLIKKMPGITVDKAGTVTARGEQVKNVTVDGKRFFGDDATAALKNLPAEIIDKIQVFDKLSDQAQFTGFDDGNSTKAINIVTKTGTRNGQFGRIYAGYGTDNRYSAGGNVSFFNGDRRLSFVGLFNNINQQNFSAEDLLGVTSSGSGRQGGGGNRGGGPGGGGNRGGGNNFGGGGNNFLVGQANGISATNAFGINYGDMWGKKIEVSGSYFFNNSNTDNNQFSKTQYVRPDSTSIYDETALSASNNYNNRVNLRMEYKIDSSNSIIFSPSVSFQSNKSGNNVTGVRYYDSSSLVANKLISQTRYNSTAKTSGFNSNNNLLFRHAFAKKGRSISLNLSAGFNHKAGDIYLESINKYYNSSVPTDSIQQFTDQLVDGKTYSANIAYTEPVGKKGQLQFSYSPSVSKSESDQQVFKYDNLSDKYAIFDSTQSNIFENTTTSHNAGASFRVGDRDNMFSIGANYKYTELNSDRLFPVVATVNKSFTNLLPNLMWRKKLSPKASVNLFYRANNNTPSVTQLQDVINKNDPLFLTSGNPDLKQQVSNVVSGRYTYTNTAKGSSFFANVFLQQANNYIANATYVASSDSVLGDNTILRKGSQLTKPVNVNGYVSVRSFLTYGMPLKFIKSNINVNAGVGWSKIPGLVNTLKSTTDNYTYNTGVVLSSNISEFVDFNISYNANFSVLKNSLQSSLNSNYLAQNSGIQLNLLNKKGWFVQNDVSNVSYSGLSAGFNQSYWLWNAGIGKKFLKNNAGELKLSVFDLLKQNTSISRTVESNYIEDVQNQVLTQYFMLTFSYKLKNFGTAAQRNQQKNDEGMQRRGNTPGF
ncbi:MAG TPA: outer membrane beta-barrel protein [Ferruginibacter sp.]|nr:outer membrane beta-barrel protein [Ferruginibacter sp.]